MFSSYQEGVNRFYQNGTLIIFFLKVSGLVYQIEKVWNNNKLFKSFKCSTPFFFAE